WHFPSNSSSKFMRLFSMLTFCFSLFWYSIFKRFSPVIFLQMSPLFVGFTGIFISHLTQQQIVLNVSDLWPLAGIEMGLLNKGWYYTILEKIEMYCYKKVDLIVGQSEEILTHIKKVVPFKTLLLYRNLPKSSPYVKKELSPSSE